MADPQMTPKEFAGYLKGKFPQLAQYGDDELVQGVLKRRPDLQSRIFSPPEVPKPTVDMERGGGAAGSTLTSFATQLANLPRNLWESSFFGELGNPRVRAEHEARIKAMEAPGLEGVKNTFQAANPVVSDESGVDVGATIANLLPYLLAVRGFRTQEATAPIRLGSRGVETLANRFRELANLNTPADEAARTPVRIPGRDIGLKPSQPSMQELTQQAIAEKRANPVRTRIKPEKAAPAPRRVAPPPVRGFKGPYEPPPEPATAKVTPPPLRGFKGPADIEAARAAEAEAAEGGIEGSLPKGRGRLVKTPEEIQQLDRAYQLQKRLAHERGMAFAGGQVPESGRTVPRVPRPQTTVEWRGLKGPAAEAAIDDQVLSALNKHGQRGLVTSLKRLGEAPELKSLTPEQIKEAATRLRDSGRVVGHTTEPDVHGPGGIVGIALK